MQTRRMLAHAYVIYCIAALPLMRAAHWLT